MPGTSTLNCAARTPSTVTVPLPLSVTESREGTVTSTLIGFLVLKLPGVVPITSLPSRTTVLTRLSRL